MLLAPAAAPVRALLPKAPMDGGGDCELGSSYVVSSGSPCGTTRVCRAPGTLSSLEARRVWRVPATLRPYAAPPRAAGALIASEEQEGRDRAALERASREGGGARGWGRATHLAGQAHARQPAAIPDTRKERAQELNRSDIDRLRVSERPVAHDTRHEQGTQQG